jgi:hypothetical protein
MPAAVFWLLVTAADGIFKCDKKGKRVLVTVIIPRISTEYERILSHQ